MGAARSPTALQPPLPGAFPGSPPPRSACFSPYSTPPPPAQLPGWGPSPDLPPTRTPGESPSQTATAAQPQLVNQSAFCAPGPAAQSPSNPLPKAWKRTDCWALQGCRIFYWAKSRRAPNGRCYRPRPHPPPQPQTKWETPTTTIPWIWYFPPNRRGEEHSLVCNGAEELRVLGKGSDRYKATEWPTSFPSHLPRALAGVR